MTGGGYVDLEQARWDLQVATGQTVAGTGVETRMREARAAAGRLAAGLPGLLDELEQLRPLPAELADARATVERVSAAWADVIQRQQLADNEHRYDVEEITGRAVAAERALEAVRAIAAKAAATLRINDPFCVGIDIANELRAALSAASPTTSDDDERARPRLHPEAVRQHERATVALDGSAGPPTASDEPARCPHGDHAFEPGIDTDMEAEGRSPDPRWCNVCGEGVPGPAASGTPDGEPVDCWPGSDR